MKTKRIILLALAVLVLTMAFVACSPEHQHVWVDADCDSPKTCSECGEIEGEALGHTELVLEAKAPTCTEAGLTAGKKCSVCDAVIEAQQTVPATGHSIVVDAAVEADCVNGGLTAGEHCSACDYKVAQEATPAKGHKDDDADYKCDACGENLCLVHTPAEAVVENKVEPTCASAGSYESVVYCADCKALISRETKEISLLPHSYVNCACESCGAPLAALSQNEKFDFTTEANYNSVVESGKLALVGSFRDNSGSYQFNTNSNIQLVVPANTVVTITGHSAQYGVFNIYLNGEKAELSAENGVYKFTVTEQTNVVIATGDSGASYSYIKSISLEEYVDRTIVSDTTINFGSEGNYKDSIVDFSAIQIGDNGGNNSQVKNGSFDLIIKAGAVVTIHGYPGYTSYQLNGGEAIESEYYTYIAFSDMTLTVTPVSGNNYFYSIEVKYHENITLVPEQASTCSVAGYSAYYSCSCHGELTEKVALDLLPHTDSTAVRENEVPSSCSVAGSYDSVVYCSVCSAEVSRVSVPLPTIAHEYTYGVCSCGHKDPSYVDYYLVGYINGADYGCESDYANAGIYKFVDGKLSAKFTNDSYVFVKSVNLNGENIGWYLTQSYETGKEATFVSGGHEKMFIPGNTDIIFTLTVNENGSLHLVVEYHTHSFSAPTCTEPGKCACGATQGTALGHNIVVDKAVEAGCLTDGLTEGEHCTACDYKVDQTVVPAKGHSESTSYDAAGHWTVCANCGLTSDKSAHSAIADGICSCGYACDDKCALCGKCEDKNCVLCSAKCEFAASSTVIPFAPSITLGAPEGPDGLAPGKEGAYIYDESIVANHVVLENGAYATVITLPNGTAAHSGVSLLNNKNQDAYGMAGYNCGIPQIKNVTLNIKVNFTNNGESAVTFTYSAIDYYFNKGAVTVTLNPGETKTVIMPTTHGSDSVGLNHQIVFPEGAEAGASISVWGEFVANENLSGVSVATEANQLRFGVGETFSAAGLVLKANGTNYNRVYITDNFITNLDGYTFTSADVGTKTVFVMFGDYAVAYTITVDDHAHNVVYVEEQSPVQCEKDGLAAHYSCTVCGTKFADQYGNKILTQIDSVSCHTAPTSGVVPGTAINCAHCGTAIGIASMDNWVQFAITTQTGSIGSNIKNGKLEHGYVEGIPGTKIHIGAGTVGATNDSAFYLKMSNNDSGWQTVIPNLGSNAPSGQLRKVILFYVNYGSEDVTLNLQNDARGGNGKVTIPANGTAVCEFTIKNSGGSNWFYLYVDSNLTTDVVIGMYGYFYVYDQEVDSISVNKPAEKLTYKVGETFSSKGLVVNVPITMSNSKTCYANTGFYTDFEGRTFTADDIGTHTVTVTFGDNTTTYVIEVVPEVDCANGEHKYDKVSNESLFVEMQGNNAIYKKACVYCGAVSDETYVADTIAFVPHAANKTDFVVEYVVLDDGRIAVKLTAKNDIAAGTKTSISTTINTVPSNTNVVFPVSGNGRRVYMEMVSNANVNITWQPEFYSDRDGVTMELVAGEAQSAVWVIAYDTTSNASQTQAALPYEEFVFNSDVAAGTEIYITGLFYERGDILNVDVNTPASKIVYRVGDKFTSAGFSFGVTSVDSLFAKVTIYNVTTNLDGKVFTSADVGTNKVIVSWGEFTYEYDILVIE